MKPCERGRKPCERGRKKSEMSKNYTVGPEVYSNEWYAMRELDDQRSPEVCLGASEAGAVCGVDKYKSALEVYLEKRGLKDRQDQTEVMKWGRIHEQNILCEYANREGVTIERPDHMWMHKEFPFISASLDAYGVGRNGRWCVDAKITTSRMFDRDNCRERDCFGENPDEIPTSYLMQAHQQMLVSGWDMCVFPVLFDGNKLRIYEVGRNDQIIDTIIERCTDMYRRIVEADPPDPDWSHSTTVDLVKKMYDIDPGLEIELPESEAVHFDTYLELKAEIGRLSKLKDMEQARLLHMMGEAAKATFPGRDRQLYKSSVPATTWSKKDVDDAIARVGTVKRRGYVKLTDRKRK